MTRSDHRPPSDRRKGIVLAAGGSLFISLDSLGLRLTEVSAWTNAFWLGLFVGISMLAFVRVRSGRSLPSVARAQGPKMAASALLQAASTLLFIISVSITAVANTVAILAAVPMVAAFVARIALGERTDRRTKVSAVAVLAGVLVVVSGSLGGGRLAGDLFAVVAIVAFSGNLTLWRRFPDLDRQVVVGLGGFIVAGVAAWPADITGAAPLAVAILAVLGLFTGPLGRVGIATSTRYLPVANVGLFVPVETVAATAWAWLFLAESPPTSTMLGGVIVIGAVVLGTIQRPARRN